MASVVDRLPAYAVPFVTRSLRRGRGRRYAAISCGFALLLLLTILWIGLGRGEAARYARIELGMELTRAQIEYREFVVIRMDPDVPVPVHRRDAATREVEKMVHEAIELVPDRASHFELRERARALTMGPYRLRGGIRFSWDDPVHVHRLAKIVERGGVPAVVDYESPLGLRGTLELLAMLSGGLLILLLTVIAPLLVALQQAREQHENTLQPLTGTALDARQLMIGLACGPLAIVAIFAAPLAILFTGAAVAVGELDCLLVLPALVGTAIGLVFGAQLLAHALGTRLAPGLIAVGSLPLLGLVALVGSAVAAEFDRELFGLPAALPHSGLFALLRDGFGDSWRQTEFMRMYRLGSAEVVLSEFWVPMVIGALGAALLGLLALQALTRHLERRDTLLGPGHALFGALICITMVDVAIPWLGATQPIHQAYGLPALVVPFALLLFARVPSSGLGRPRRRIPMTRLSGEFAGWTLIHMIVGAALDFTAWGFHPIAVLGIGLCTPTVVLLVVGLVATPGRILGRVWMTICLVMMPLSYLVTSYPALTRHLSVDTEMELAVVWMIMASLIPLTMVRRLRKRGIQLH